MKIETMLPAKEYLLGMRRKVVSHLSHQFGDTKLLVHLLVIVFAMSSWADLNGLLVEVPLLVEKVPEKWSLPSFITVISQVANIGPLLFVALTLLMPQTKHKLEKCTSMIIIIIGIISALLLAFFWQETSYIGEVNHSTALLTLNFFLALGDCTSSVSFYAFMSLLKPQYMASLFLGEGLSGMFPALIALGQGAGDIRCVNRSETTNKAFSNGTEYNTTTYTIFPEYVKPSFSVEVFFFTLAAILALSGLAFILLNFLPYCQSEMVEPNLVEYQQIVSETDESQPQSYGSLGDSSSAASEILQQVSGEQGIRKCLCLTGISMHKFCSCLAIIVIINLTLTSFLSSISIYSILPYGIQPYHLSSTLTPIANPIACFFALIFITESLAVVSVITTFGLVGVAYIIYLSTKSPSPPLQDHNIGAVLAVGTWIVMTLLLIYAKVCVAMVMRRHGRYALICAGVATQVGSLIGAIIGFVLVQYTDVFVAASYC